MLSISLGKQERIAFLKIGDILLQGAVVLAFIAGAGEGPFTRA